VPEPAPDAVAAPVRRSPLLDLDGAVEADPPDRGVAAHYGELTAEQRRLERGEGFVDLSHRDVLRVTGPDRLTWLHSLTTQHLESLAPGEPTEVLLLSPQGRIEHAFSGIDDGTTFWAHTEPGAGTALVTFLDRMRFMMRVEVADASDSHAVVGLCRSAAQGPAPLPGRSAAQGPAPLPGRSAAQGPAPLPGRSAALAWELRPREEVASWPERYGRPAGTWAWEALRIASGTPRFGLDTDDRTIPNEVGLLERAVHLDKGCYRGQETVARVHTLGRPPRRLVLLHLDGSVDRLPAPGSAVEVAGGDGKAVGTLGSRALHHELGPIGLAVVKRSTPVEADLLVDGVAASQEAVVDPDVGLHVRPRSGR
jgi:folate-binding protein YgfZ